MQIVASTRNNLRQAADVPGAAHAELLTQAIIHHDPERPLERTRLQEGGEESPRRSVGIEVQEIDGQVLADAGGKGALRLRLIDAPRRPLQSELCSLARVLLEDDAVANVEVDAREEPAEAAM